MKKLKQFCLGTMGVLLILFSPSCINDEDYDFDKLSEKIDWTPNMIVPVGHGTYSLWYLLNQHETNPDDVTIHLVDDMIHIKHKEPGVFTYNAQEVISFPPQGSQQTSLTIPVEINIADPGTAPVSLGDESSIYSINIDDQVKLLSLDLSAKILFTIDNPISERVQITISLPKLTQSGSPVTKTYTVDANDKISETLLLSDINIDLTESYPDNTLPFNFNFTILPQGDPISVNAGEKLSISYKMLDIEFEKAVGNFGQQIIDIGSGELDMDVDFWDDIQGQFRFEDPRIDLNITNNAVVVPFLINANLTGYNADGLDPVSLNPQPLQPKYPNQSNMDKPFIVKEGYDKHNSDIVDFMALPPSQKIEYSGNVTLNPGSDPFDISEPNIITNTSSINVDMEIDIPMNLSAKNLILQDTISDVDISDSDKIKFGKLVIVTKNGLPMDVTLQKIYLTDDSYQKLDSIDNSTIFDAAQVFPPDNSNAGKVDPSKIVQQEQTIELSQKLIQKLDQTKNIIIKAVISTTKDEKNSPVKLMGDDQLEFKMAIQVQADLNN